MKIENKQDYEKFLERLQDSKSDETYRKMNKNISKTKQEMIGVRAPELRKIAKEVFKDGGVKGLFEFGGDRYFEETTARGLALGGFKKPEEIMEYLPRFVRSVDNWATCDMTCSSLKAFEKHGEKYFDYFKGLALSNEEFIARFGFIMLMCHYMKDEYIDEILALTKSFENHAYYVDMGVAWLISAAMVKFPEKAENLLKEQKLTPFVQNKAIQKTRESFRISAEVKNRILDYKMQK